MKCPPGLHKLIQLGTNLDREMSTFFPPCNVEMGLSYLVTGGAINCESTVLHLNIYDSLEGFIDK